jgi:hypothetical protein
MNRFPVLLLCSGVVALAGCASGTSQAPVPITYPRTVQHKMQAAHHWEVLAEYEASRILDAVPEKSKPIFVEAPAPGGSAFEMAYHNMLQEYLVKGDGTVVNKPMFGGVTVGYLAQTLRHTDRGYVAPAPGTYTALGAGAVVVGAAAAEWEPAVLAALPVLLAADLTSGGYASVSPTEVIITTRVLEGNLVVMSDTDVFYYNPGDGDHYLSQAALRRGQVFQVVDQ